MAVIETTRPAPAGAIAAFKFVSVVERAIAAVADWNTERKTVAALSKLTDHELNDIGISRHDIRNFAHPR